MPSHIRSIIVAAAAGLTLSLIVRHAGAQWSSDPAVNLPLANMSNSQEQAKIRRTSDDGAYVSWYDNRTGGYDVYIQRLNARGEEQWPHNGILLADTAFSS